MENIDNLNKQISDLQTIIEMDENELKEQYRELKYHFECEQSQREFFENSSNIKFNKLKELSEELKKSKKELIKAYDFMDVEMSEQKHKFNLLIEEKIKIINSLINDNETLKGKNKTLQIKYDEIFEQINNDYTPKETLKNAENKIEELTNRLNFKIESIDVENKIVELNKKIKKYESNFICNSCEEDGEISCLIEYRCKNCGNSWNS